MSCQPQPDAFALLGAGRGPGRPRPLTALPAPGDRVRLRADVDRSPHFVATIGMTGTVVRIDAAGGHCDIRIDTNLGPGAREWDNCLLVSDQDADWDRDERLDSPGALLLALGAWCERI